MIHLERAGTTFFANRCFQSLLQEHLFEITGCFCRPNISPVHEFKETVLVTTIKGKVSDDFPEGVYVRNGPNPVFGDKSQLYLEVKSHYVLSNEALPSLSLSGVLVEKGVQTSLALIIFVLDN
ncbi:hypothetical protein SADUNF_Sadunf06G0191600 [Salix dunnii]|uniref:Uncharacterized protein n=1 Tax=Salix dunnii TaxID=1413687 RepID=A0A835MW52_9ROSI|nr:hypothetical protein SADUNF_Sadunf06G0191600 [Salix dunnii]